MPYTLNEVERVDFLRVECRKCKVFVSESFYDVDVETLAETYNGIGSISIFPACLEWLGRFIIWIVTMLVPSWELVALPHDYDGRGGEHGRTDFSFLGFCRWNWWALRNGFRVALKRYRIIHLEFWCLIAITIIFYLILMSPAGWIAWKD